MEVVQVPVEMFHRMSKALIRVEKYLEVKEEDWLEEADAVFLLGCSQRQLYRLKKTGEIKYKAVGKRHQYERRSIDNYNKKMSSC